MSESRPGAGLPSPPAAGGSPTAGAGAWCQCIIPPAAGRSPAATVGAWCQCISPPAAGRSPTATVGALWCQCITPPAAGRNPARAATVGVWCQRITPPAAGRSPPACHRVRGRSPTLQYTGRAQQSHSRHGDRSPTASARGPCPTDTNQGLVVTFQVTGRAQPQQSVPSQATARPSVASHAGHRIPAGGGRYQRSYLSCRADRAGAHRDRGPLRADFTYSEQPR